MLKVVQQQQQNTPESFIVSVLNSKTGSVWMALQTSFIIANTKGECCEEYAGYSFNWAVKLQNDKKSTIKVL